MPNLADLFVTAGEVSGTTTSPETLLFVAARYPCKKSQELERYFFDCLRLKNGTYKTTYAHRLDDLNAHVASYLPSAEPLEVLDVAISSGVSTLEWADLLETAKVQYHITGIDLSIGGVLVSFGNRLHTVLDHKNRPLLYEIDGRWVSNRPLQICRHLLQVAFVKFALFLWARKGAAVQRILRMPTRSRAVSLVTPKLLSHPRVTIKEGDILTESSLQGTFHVIRAANILNRAYFDDDVLADMMRHFRSHLIENGIFVICDTDKDINRATVFKLKEDKQFAVLSTMNGGSGLEELILKLR